MKKLIALALALVMVLGLAVTSFAAIELKEDTGDDEVELIEINELDEVEYRGVGGTYYFEISDGADYKNLKVEATGSVTAKLVDYDPEVFEDLSKRHADLDVEGRFYFYVLKIQSGKDDDRVSGRMNYEAAKELAKEKNDKNKDKSVKYVVKASKNVKLVEVTIEDNFTAAYKEGKVTVTGTGKKGEDGKYDTKTYTSTVTVISDVAIFGYEDVKQAAEYGLALNSWKNEGYSDYETSKTGYDSADQSAVLDDDIDPTVVCTTAFRAIKGKDLIYNNRHATVTIKEVADGQKGVNFAFAQKVTAVKDGKEFTYTKDNGDYNTNEKGAIKTYEFGFKGNQVIASDFTIEYDLGRDYFELREDFGVKLEEEDIVNFYVLKDGKLIDTIKVDYKDVDPDDDVELTINGKAGETLGWYTIQLTAPAAEEPEENPNTGAETMVGAVVALAIVSMASAAAVSLKK